MGISKTKLKRFTSLHSHTTFSYGDGYGTVAEHADRLAELGNGFVVATEHGNVSSWVQVEKEATKRGMRPVFGIEAYAAPPKTRQKFHQTILAENYDGLRNLNEMVGESWAEGFYQWPTVHGDNMMRHSSGLIMTSGCADSLLSCTLLGGKSLGPRRDRASTFDMKEAERVVRRFQSMLGEDSYFLEVQRFPGLERARTLNPAFAELSRRTGAPLVATADVHYPYGTQNEMQKILHAAHRGGTVESVDAEWEYDILLTYPTSDYEIYQDLIATGLTPVDAWAAICNTAEIADRCGSLTLPKNEQLRYPVPDGWSAEELIWEWLREGWTYRIARNPHMQANPDSYVERLKYEMVPIVAKDYPDYFLVVSDAVRYAKDNGIPVGPARGSAAASLVCYLLRITEVDPMQFPTMVFERFIDLSRLDMPDIDLDFADDRREEVVQYLVRKWGRERVANIGNFVKYKGRNSVVDVARVYNIPKYAEDAVKSVALDRSGGDSRADESLADAIEMFPQAREAVERFPDLRRAVDLEGNMRGMSVHAAGVVISNRPIAETSAMYTREVAGHNRSVLAYDKYDCDYLGMLKIDMLGLSTMGMIGLVLDMIGMDLDELYRVPLTDERTLDAFRRNDVVGIFQFEGRATRLVNAGVVPDHFMHLADVNALSRPGPLFSGMTTDYMDVKHGRKEPDRLHPLVWEQTKHTYGQIIYQEQVLNIVRHVGGFPVEHIGDIRRAISKKLGEAHMNTMRQEFVDGAGRLHDIDQKLAVRIWNFMVTSATYSFNVAHCISYSMLGFWCMYLKQNYPREFYAAQLQKIGDDKKAREHKRPRLMVDAVRNGWEILPPHPELSGVTWYPDANNREGIRAGFVQCPGVGQKTAASMVDHRDRNEDDGRHGYVWGWEDFTAVKGIGPATMRKIDGFSRQDDPFEIEVVSKRLAEIRTGINRGYKGYRGLPKATHVSHTIPRDRDAVVTWMGLVSRVEMKDLIEDQRARTGESVEEIRARIDRPDLVKFCTLHCYDDGDEEVFVRINRYNWSRFEELVSKIIPRQDVIIVRGKKKKSFGVSLAADGIIHLPMGDEAEGEEDE